MRFKSGIVAVCTGPEMKRAWRMADLVFLAALGREAKITSLREGDHSQDSKHYLRLLDDERYPSNVDGSQGAFDLRTWRGRYDARQLPRDIKEGLAEALRLKLGPRWTVLVEGTHIHCQDNATGIASEDTA